jgi:hypothetical protein
MQQWDCYERDATPHPRYEHGCSYFKMLWNRFIKLEFITYNSVEKCS